MADERAVVPGISSRRFACDRCRGQKLRCLRDNDDQRCRRCVRADAQCITSSIFRMRNYHIGDEAAVRSRSRRHGNMNASHQSTGSSSTVSTSAETIDLPTASVNIFTNREARTGSSDSTQPSQVSSTTMSISEHLNATTTADLAWYSSNPSAFDFIVSPKLPSLETHEHYAENDSVMDHTQMSYDQPALSQAPLPSSQTHVPAASNLQGFDYMERDGFALDLEDTSFTEVSGIQAGDPPVEETHTQQLLHINSELITLATRIDQGVPNVTLDTLLSPACDSAAGVSKTLIEDILNHTRKFLDVLNSMADPGSRSSPSGTSSTGPSPTSDSEPGALRVQTNVVMTRDDSLASSPEDSQPSPTTSPKSLRIELKPTPEITTQLQILNCYVHVLRLYVVLFFYIQDYLQEVAKSDNPSICPIPGLSFSHFSLQSGNLQATLFIQIVTSLFESMEKLLGLPRDLQISSRGRDHHGLLSDAHFIPILEGVMRKEEAPTGSQPPEKGVGGVKALRRSMKRAKQLLRDNIAP